MSHRVYHFNNLGEFIGQSEYEGIRIPMNSTLSPPPQVDPTKEKAVFDFTARGWEVKELVLVEVNQDALITQLTPSIYIIDDFYRDPDEVRRKALSLNYVRYAPSFPGRRSPNLTGLAPRDYFQKILGHPIKWGTQCFEEKAGSGVINECNGVFQLMCADDGLSTYVHADDQMDYAGVCYLNVGKDDELGTGFFKHIQTGFERMPTPKECFAWGSREGQLPSNLRAKLNESGKDSTAWELQLVVPMRFNRLVFYDAQLFHRNMTSFGQGLDTGRLTQTFFLSRD